MNKVKLGDVCTIVSGSTPKTGNPEYWDGDIDWITPAELTDDSYIIHESIRKITKEGVEKTGLKPFPAGTVILSSRAPIGKVAIAGKEMYCNQGFKNLICGENIDSEYLFWFLKSNTSYLNSLGRGATFKEISKAIVENIQIQLPPLFEQRLCAQSLKQIWKIMSLRNQELAKLDDLIKSQFLGQFGHIKDEKWPVMKLSEICTDINDGEHASVKRVNEGKLFISSRNITSDGHMVLSPVTYVTLSDFERIRLRFSPHEGDILITCAGTIGNAVIVPDMEPFVADRGITVIKPNRQSINSDYLYHALRSEEVQVQMRERTRATALAHLYLKQIKELDIIVPPLPLQEQFAAFVRQSDKSKYQVQNAIRQEVFFNV